MPNRQRFNYEGRQVTVIGPSAEDDTVWITQDTNGGIVYLSRETIAAALGEVGAYTAVATAAEPAAAAPAAVPVTAEAPVPVQVPVERPRCPACTRAYTGELGTGHRCEQLKAVSCVQCSALKLELINDPPRAGLVCATCANAGFFICKRCGVSVQQGRMKDICDRCNPLQAHDIWAMGTTSVGNDITVHTRSHRSFAVEIESFLDPTQVTAEFRTPQGWDAGHDGSIRPDPGASDAREFRSPPFRGDGGLARLYADVTKLRAQGWRANKTCGLHVHIDMTDTSKQDRMALHKFGTWIEEDIYKLVASSRARNRYCKKLASFETDTADKYKWLSIQSYSRHRTVEVRLHHGVTNPETVMEWVKVCLRIVERGMKLGVMATKPEASLFNLLDFSDYERKFWLSTAKKLHGRNVEVR